MQLNLPYNFTLISSLNSNYFQKTQKIMENKHIQSIQIQNKQSMLFQHSKKQKQQRINRQSLKMFNCLLTEKQSTKNIWNQLLERSQPKIKYLNYLRIVTCIEINYHIQTVFEVLKKINQSEQILRNEEEKKVNKTNKKQEKLSDKIQSILPGSISQLKVGIIGGGVMGRLILNSLLVFTKDGLNPKNIYLSTRQVDDLNSYHTNFGINIDFDNEKAVEQSDILIICVPSTLDNWIINDLKPSFSERIKQPNRICPLVFITTSNMNPQKLRKLFDFPILSPTVKGQSKQILDKLVKLQTCQEVEKQLQQIIFPEEKKQLISQTLFFMFLKHFQPTNVSKTQTVISSYQHQSSNTVSIGNTSQISRSIQSNKIANNPKYSKSISVRDGKSAEDNDQDKDGIQILKQLIEQVMTLQNNNQKQTFLVRARKWRMAYNNYIA